MVELVILGASGSIGSQTLRVIKRYPKKFLLTGISIGLRTWKIPHIVASFPSIKAITIQDEDKIPEFEEKYPNIKFFSKDKGLIDLIRYLKPNMVVNALVGFVGVKPTIFSLQKNIDVALANKESLVVAGEYIDKILKKSKAKIYPIDSEHSALWKCLNIKDTDIEYVVITSSGGAFRNLTYEQLNNVTVNDALKHPTWKMGKKITIDCATMVNKAFEVIEAYYLFHLPVNKIHVLLHKESMVHGLVKYQNGPYLLEISNPNMANPIAYALFKGDHKSNLYEVDSLSVISDFSFEDLDVLRYPLFTYCYQVLSCKGISGAVFNAANEVAVNLFLEGKIRFLDIDKIIKHCMSNIKDIPNPSYHDYLKVDKKTRQIAYNFYKKEL